jgi:hypothetical protein
MGTKEKSNTISAKKNQRIKLRTPFIEKQTSIFV